MIGANRGCAKKSIPDMRSLCTRQIQCKPVLAGAVDEVRLYNEERTLDAMEEDRKLRIGRELLEIYAGAGLELVLYMPFDSPWNLDDFHRDLVDVYLDTGNLLRRGEVNLYNSNPDLREVSVLNGEFNHAAGVYGSGFPSHAPLFIKGAPAVHVPNIQVVTGVPFDLSQPLGGTPVAQQNCPDFASLVVFPVDREKGDDWSRYHVDLMAEDADEDRVTYVLQRFPSKGCIFAPQQADSPIYLEEGEPTKATDSTANRIYYRCKIVSL